MDLKQAKKYEETISRIQDELAKQDIPKPVFEKVINIIDEAELTHENRNTFLFVLLAKSYNEGRIQGINEERERNDIIPLYENSPENSEEGF